MSSRKSYYRGGPEIRKLGMSILQALIRAVDERRPIPGLVLGLLLVAKLETKFS